MATAIGALSVDLSANSAAFAADMGKASRAVRSNSARINRSLGAVDKRFAGMSRSLKRFVSVAAVVGLSLLTKRAVESADRIGKLADAVGLSTDQLQEYRHASELSGVATEKFDRSLLQFAKRIGEGREETGTLVEFLRRNNQELLTTILNTNSTGQALDVMFEAIANTADATDRAALATAAFGRSGVEMVNLVREGAGGLAAMREEARRLGIVLDESMVREAEKANDQIERMSRIMGVNLQRVLLTLTPTIIAVGDALVAGAPALAAWAEGFGAIAFGDAVRNTEALKEKLAGLRAELAEIEDSPFGAGSSGLLEIEDDPEPLRQKVAELEALIEARERSARSMKALMDSLAGGDGGGGESPVEKSIQALDREITALDTRLFMLGQTEGAVARANSQQRLHNLLLDNNVKLTDEQAARYATLHEQLETRTNDLAAEEERLRAVEDAARNNERAFDATGQAGAGAMRDITLGAMKADDALRSLGLRLADIIMQAALFGPAQSAISAALSGAFAANSPTGGDVGGTPFAHGGQFTVGGRGGTDANFVPLQLTRGEQVTVQTPEQQRAGGGGGDVYQIDARGADSAGLRRLESLIASLNGSIEGRAVAAVADASRRRPGLVGR